MESYYRKVTEGIKWMLPRPSNRQSDFSRFHRSVQPAFVSLGGLLVNFFFFCYIEIQVVVFYLTTAWCVLFIVSRTEWKYHPGNHWQWCIIRAMCPALPRVKHENAMDSKKPCNSSRSSSDKHQYKQTFWQPTMHKGYLTDILFFVFHEDGTRRQCNIYYIYIRYTQYTYYTTARQSMAIITELTNYICL